jgi:hypothetical protein
VTRLERARVTAACGRQPFMSDALPGCFARAMVDFGAIEEVWFDHEIAASLLLDGYPAKWRVGPPTGGER